MLKDIDSIIPGTIIQAYHNDKTEELIAYKIIPQAGYKIHHKSLDVEIYDKETCEPTGDIELGYTESFI